MCTIVILQVYAETLVSAYELDGYIVVYVVND